MKTVVSTKDFFEGETRPKIYVGDYFRHNNSGEIGLLVSLGEDSNEQSLLLLVSCLTGKTIMPLAAQALSENDTVVLLGESAGFLMNNYKKISKVKVIVE